MALAVVLASPAALAQQPAQPGSVESRANVADPPLVPSPPLVPATQPSSPPPEAPPTSASGTDLAPATPPATQPAAQPVVPSAADHETEARQDANMRELEARLDADERRMRRLEERQRALRYFKLGAFVQAQYLAQSFNSNASPNLVDGSLPAGIGSNDVIAKSDGSTTNGNAFRMRRTRLRATFEAAPARLYVELDPFPLGGAGPGIGTVVRDAEATGIARWGRDVRTEVTAGVFMLPASLELRERSDVRPFIERTWAVQNVFPAERDVGVHARTVAMSERLVLDLGIVNGQRLGEPRFVAEPDLNKEKDFVGHLRYRLGPLGFGVSGYAGRGQVVDAKNLRFKRFTRWWVDYELSAHQRLVRPLGETRLVVELAIAENMDTGQNYPFAVPAIPANMRDDVTSHAQRALYVRLEQDLTRWAQVGYRYDFYTTDTAIQNNARDTHAFITVLRFSPNLRWMNELDYAIDNVHPAPMPAAAKQILAFSSVLQAGF